MTQTQITILRVRKGTRNKLKSRALTKRESYDEIINRLMKGTSEDQTENLETEKEELIKQGISKTLVNMLGTINKIGLGEEKEMVRRAITRKMMQ